MTIHPHSEEDLVTMTALRWNKPRAAIPSSVPFIPAALFRTCAGLSFVPDYRLTPEHPFTATLISSAEVVAITRFARISQVFAAFTFLASRTSVPSVPFSCLGLEQSLHMSRHEPASQDALCLRRGELVHDKKLFCRSCHCLCVRTQPKRKRARVHFAAEQFRRA